MYGLIFALLTLVICILVVGIILYVFVISNKTVEEPATTVPSPIIITPSPPAPGINWSENLRNNVSNGNLPPCSQTDPFIKNIFTTLSKLNLVQRYFNLLDIMSIILCYEADICNSVFDRERLVQVIGMGGDPQDKDSREYLKAFTTIQKTDTMTTRFLVACLNLIQKQTNLIKVDKDITRQDSDAILGHIYSFLVSHIDNIYKLCP